MTSIRTLGPVPQTALAAPRRRSPRRRRVAAAVGALVLAAVLPAGAAAPGGLPGWRLAFSESFSTDAALGDFPGQAYRGRWTDYDGFADTSGAGRYDTGRVVSVHDGVLDMYLHTEDGVPRVAAPMPLVDGRWGGLTYGRFSVRFRADPIEGYKTAWLLWPDSDVWADGEVDFPEGTLDDQMYAANLRVGHPGQFDLRSPGLAGYDAWHVATTEWTPDAVTFFLDGHQVASSASSPSTPMHWVLQTETAFGPPPADVSGHVEVDWVTVQVPA